MAEGTKKTKHMSGEITKEDIERLCREVWEMSPEEHDALVKKMGITEEEDKEWHDKHGFPRPAPPDPERKSVNPFAIGGGFLDYCVKQGWLVREGKGRSTRYYPTEQGIEELKKFGIEL